MKDRIRSYPVVTAVLFLCMFIILIGSHSCATESAKKNTELKTKQKAPESKTDFRVIAYYFHANFRCVTCKKVENLSEKAIKTGFAGELKDGTVDWHAVNVEVKGNEHFIQDYKLYSKSLVLVEMVGDKQVKWKNLESIWKLVNKEDAYLKYVQDEVKMYLSDAPGNPEKKVKKKASK